jgi:hypothetical protein
MTSHASPSQLDSLAAKLASSNVSEMATSLAADPQITALWHETPNAGAYAALVTDGKRGDSLRFAAALVLLSENAEAFWTIDRPVLAQVFATALQKDLAGWAYPWGWLWASPGDPVGTLGRIFVEIGAPAVPALRALLRDPTSRSTYLGSEDATEMAMKRYRVKDFAAFYLARIAKLELPWEQNLAKRDEAIEKLTAQL